jgi:hypothetical protein
MSKYISTEGEMEILNELMQEISEETGIDIFRRLVLDRCSSDMVFANFDPGKMHVFVAGASHAASLVSCLVENGVCKSN